MPFTSLLLTGLVPNGKLTEHSITISVSNQDQNNTVLLFAADKCHEFHNVYLKQTQPDKSEPSCCDAICFAHLPPRGRGSPSVIICFIECKSGGKDQTKKAGDQILRTYEGIKKRINELEINPSIITWKALVVNNSSTLNKEIDKELDKIREKFGGKPGNVRAYTYKNKTLNLNSFIETSVLPK